MNSLESFIIYLSRCPDEEFTGNLDNNFIRYFDKDNVFCMETGDSNAIINLLHLFKVYVPKDGIYVYTDGTKAVFVKTQMCWKLKKRNKVYCKIIMK